MELEAEYHSLTRNQEEKSCGIYVGVIVQGIKLVYRKEG